MTALLDQAIDHVRSLPDDVQDDLARLMLLMSGVETAAYPLSAKEAASLAVSLEQAASGQFASDATIDAIWSERDAK